jgi:hypothetical protein
MKFARRTLLGMGIVLSMLLLPGLVRAQSPAAPAVDLEVLTLGNGGSCTSALPMGRSLTAVPEPSWAVSPMPTGCGECVHRLDCPHIANCVSACINTCCEYTCQ